MMLYILSAVCAYLLVREWLLARFASQNEEPPAPQTSDNEDEEMQIASHPPEELTVEPTAPLTLDEENDELRIERIDEVKDGYYSVLTAIDREKAALLNEYGGASVKRRSAISAKLTALEGRRASTLRTICALDEKQR